MEKVVLLQPGSSTETVIHQVNELSKATRLNEINIDNLVKYNSAEKLSSVKELYEVSDDLKKYFSESLDKSIEKHSIELFELMTNVSKEIDILKVNNNQLAERVSALENRDKEIIYSRWQKIKSKLSDIVDNTIVKIIIFIIMFLVGIRIYEFLNGVY